MAYNILHPELLLPYFLEHPCKFIYMCVVFKIKYTLMHTNYQVQFLIEIYADDSYNAA